MRPTRLLQFGAAFAVVAFVVARSHPGELWDAVRDVDATKALAALALNLPVLALAPLRSALLFRRLGHRVPAGILLPTTVLGFVAGGLTPAASGELLRAQALRSRAAVPVGEVLAVVLYERVLSVWVLALTAAAVAAVTELSFPVAAGVVLTCGALVWLPWFAAGLLGILAPENGANEEQQRTLLTRALDLATQVRGLFGDPVLLLATSAISASIFGLIAVQYGLLARGVGADVTFGDAWIALAISTFAGIAALIPLGLGILDGSLAATLDRLGATLSQGAAVAVLVRAVVTLPLVLAAFASFVYLQRAVDGPRGEMAGGGVEAPVRPSTGSG
jgi:uncharacterized protein (TIRG00374 family)